jgi:transcriptional regulator with XRE-family HTH domain
VPEAYGGVVLPRRTGVGEVIGLGRKRPDGNKIVELRKQHGLKQEVLAEKVSISVRLLRDIERKNHEVPSTTLTAIATELKVSPDQITLPAQEDSQQDQLLKLRLIRSASELKGLAQEAHQFWWDVNVDPTAATTKEMQQLLRIIRRLMEMPSITDEFDNEDATGPKDAPNDFGYIKRLARLKESLDTLWEAGVGVLAATYWANLVTDKEDKTPGALKKIRIPGSEEFLKFVCTLEIRFVPSNVDEEVISIDLGVPWERIESLFQLEKGSLEALTRRLREDLAS